jgi:hypothetical protein
MRIKSRHVPTRDVILKGPATGTGRKDPSPIARKRKSRAGLSAVTEDRVATIATKATVATRAKIKLSKRPTLGTHRPKNPRRVK